MSKRAFTEEEKELLSKNKFVKHVGDRGITYTKEYKIRSVSRKNAGLISSFSLLNLIAFS